MTTRPTLERQAPLRIHPWLTCALASSDQRDERPLRKAAPDGRRMMRVGAAKSDSFVDTVLPSACISEAPLLIVEHSDIKS